MRYKPFKEQIEKLKSKRVCVSEKAFGRCGDTKCNQKHIIRKPYGQDIHHLENSDLLIISGNCAKKILLYKRNED